jgi:hypothetical protein
VHWSLQLWNPWIKLVGAWSRKKGLEFGVGIVFNIKMAASVAWDHFVKVKLAEPGRPIPALAFGWCLTCTPFDAETMKVIADSSAAGTSHEELAGT